jgi:hypothetical protein
MGNRARHSGSGALVGGAAGVVFIGHGMDQAQEARLKAQAPETMRCVEQSLPLTVADVKALAKAGIGDDLVINQIRNSRTVYHLVTADIIDLKNSGVSEKVIDFMIITPTQIQSVKVAGVVGIVPPSPRVEQVVAAPGLDYFWVGGTWVWFGDRWVWHTGYWHRPLSPHEYGPGWRGYSLVPKGKGATWSMESNDYDQHGDRTTTDKEPWDGVDLGVQWNW